MADVLCGNQRLMKVGKSILSSSCAKNLRTDAENECDVRLLKLYLVCTTPTSAFVRCNDRLKDIDVIYVRTTRPRKEIVFAPGLGLFAH